MIFSASAFSFAATRSLAAEEKEKLVSGRNETALYYCDINVWLIYGSLQTSMKILDGWSIAKFFKF